MSVSNREHRAILAALAARDAAEAGRLMRDHILAGKKRLQTLTESEPAPLPQRRTRDFAGT